MTYKSKIYAIPKEETVFLRADLNVPIENNKIFNDYKLQKIVPTLDALLEKNTKIILATHIAKSKDKISTQILIDWFKNRNYKIEFAQSIKLAKTLTEKSAANIILLENLRFFKEQSRKKEERSAFAQELFSLAKYYVNDGWGVVHRKDVSITDLPNLYQKNNKTFGLIIESELNHLSKIKDNPDRPFVAILGGGKVKDKLPLIWSLLDYTDLVLVGPLISFAFCQLEENKKIILPIDYLENGEICSIGLQTLELFKEKLKTAKTIFLNGTMGLFDRPETMKEFEELLRNISQSTAYTVIGGGDAVAAVYRYGLENKIKFLSTGGGATLRYLARDPLPGLEAIVDFA